MQRYLQPPKMKQSWRTVGMTAALWLGLAASSQAVPSYDEVRSDHRSSETLLLSREGEVLQRLRTDATVRRGTVSVISGKIAKDLFEILWTEGGDPRQIVEARGMKQVTDTGAIEAAIDAVISANPDKVEQVKAKPTMLGWFVGQVMKQMQGKADAARVRELILEKLV